VFELVVAGGQIVVDRGDGGVDGPAQFFSAGCWRCGGFPGGASPAGAVRGLAAVSTSRHKSLQEAELPFHIVASQSHSRSFSGGALEQG